MKQLHTQTHNSKLSLQWSQKCIVQRTKQTNKMLIILQLLKQNWQETIHNGKCLSTWFDQSKFCIFKQGWTQVTILHI